MGGIRTWTMESAAKGPLIMTHIVGTSLARLTAADLVTRSSGVDRPGMATSALRPGKA